MVQEVYSSYPSIRDVCAAGIFNHAKSLESDISDVRQAQSVAGDWTTEGLARHIQAVVQGSFIIAKASGDAREAIESLNHLKNYIGLLFSSAGTKKL
jgi:TetR/AcrR family transcriptional regulator, transcriptional repressor for nem operon